MAPDLGALPPVRPVSAAEVARAIDGGPCVVVLDDDPTGTQTVADVPVITGWSGADVRWGVRHPACYVLTNTRSLPAREAADRNREVVRALRTAGRDIVVASRSDSTLRGHFPLETDVLADELGPIDGVVLAPAYVEAGRVTLGATHWMRTPAGLVPVGETEFARDATFGYHSSDLREWVAEKTAGRIKPDQVLAVGIEDVRLGGPDHVAGLLSTLRDRQPVVVDAVCDDDLRVLALAIVRAEAAGTRLLYRVGPSFVRARIGQAARDPLPGPESTGHGLIVAGSHVDLTTRQLAELRKLDGVREIELSAPAVLDPGTRGGHIADVAAAAAKALQHGDVVIRTSREVVRGNDGLAIAREVSSALVETVTATAQAQRPAFVIAKGGITSSDIATESLGIRRAIARGTLLPGIVSLWEPVGGPFAGMPYVVFAGNVGDEHSLAAVVEKLRSA
ncbi:four-carbon acid sugar kinase family protein [Amycolatopsis jejuensis]|uniref:four-carbon acid sugar kinase family protein n=1 Tax=Amycolatopsis jejuensis TaxID=330084 RepID=UPI00052538B2|nr:four-carbon acid sugar kinase family protein [Amycolatopsis jejuensis]